MVADGLCGKRANLPWPVQCPECCNSWWLSSGWQPPTAHQCGHDLVYAWHVLGSILCHEQQLVVPHRRYHRDGHAPAVPHRGMWDFGHALDVSLVCHDLCSGRDYVLTGWYGTGRTICIASTNSVVLCYHLVHRVWYLLLLAYPRTRRAQYLLPPKRWRPAARMTGLPGGVVPDAAPKQ
jgi:hypothetical protein